MPAGNEPKGERSTTMTRTISIEKWLHGKTDGQKLALLKKLYEGAGGNDEALEGFEGLVRDELTAQVTFKDGAMVLVDRNGCGIKIASMKDLETVKFDPSFSLTHPGDQLSVPYDRIKEFYGAGHQFPSLAEVTERYGVAVERVKADRQVKNLVRGPHFLFVIPKMQGDLGTLLDDTIVPAFDRSYRAQFPGRTFTNYRHGELSGQVTIIDDTRQERLPEAMAKNWVVGVYFPCLRGFSMPADRAWIKAAPQFLILSGLEVMVAATAYPEIIARDFKTSGLDMAALQWQSADYSLRFRALGGEAYFGRRGLGAHGRDSGGVSVLG